MRTPKEVRARMADFEARAEAENRASGAKRDPLKLEMLWRWAGALRWVLNEEPKRKA